MKKKFSQRKQCSTYVGQFLINKVYVLSVYFYDKYHTCLNFIQSNNINWMLYLY